MGLITSCVTVLAPTRKRASYTSPGAPYALALSSPLGVFPNHADISSQWPDFWGTQHPSGASQRFGAPLCLPPSTARRRHTLWVPAKGVGWRGQPLYSWFFPCDWGLPLRGTVAVRLGGSLRIPRPPHAPLLAATVSRPLAQRTTPLRRPSSRPGVGSRPPPLPALRPRPPAGGTPFGSLPKVWVGGVAPASLSILCRRPRSAASHGHDSHDFAASSHRRFRKPTCGPSPPPGTVEGRSQLVIVRLTATSARPWGQPNLTGRPSGRFPLRRLRRIHTRSSFRPRCLSELLSGLHPWPRAPSTLGAPVRLPPQHCGCFLRALSGASPLLLPLS